MPSTTSYVALFGGLPALKRSLSCKHHFTDSSLLVAASCADCEDRAQVVAIRRGRGQPCQVAAGGEFGSRLSSRAFSGARGRASVEVRLDVPQECAPPCERRSNPSGQVHGRPACFTFGLAPAFHVLSATSLDASARGVYYALTVLLALYPLFPHEHMWRQPRGTRIPPYPPCILRTSACMGTFVRPSSFCVRLAQWVATRWQARKSRSCCCSAWRCDQAVLHHPRGLHPLQSSAMLRLAGVVDACPLLQHLPFRLAQGLLKTMLFPNLPAFPPSTGPSLSPTTHVPRLLRPASTPTLALMVSRCIPYTTWRLLLSFLPPWAKHCTLSHHTQSAA